MRFSATSLVFAVAATVCLSGCETTGPNDGTLVGPANGSRPIGGLFSGPAAPSLPAVDNDIAVACQEAAGDKYFMDPDLARAVSSTTSGSDTLVTLKVDSRDALCTLNSKGKVVSIVDTSPKSADQMAAEEQRAADIASGKVPATPDVKKVVKKKKKAKVAAAAPKVQPVLGAR